MTKSKSHKENVLFRYGTYPTSDVLVKESDGRSITITNSAKVIYHKYKFGSDEVIYENIIQISNDLIKKIEKIITKNWSKINSVPDTLYSGSCDGNMNDFTFKTIKKRAFNIYKNDIDKVKETNLQYYNLYKDNMEYENMLIDVFEQIAKIAKEYNLILDLYNDNF